MAIDYFLKQVEACSYAYLTKQVVKQFIKKDLIYRYGLLGKIETDNAQNFNGKMIIELYAKWSNILIRLSIDQR